MEKLVDLTKNKFCKIAKHAELLRLFLNEVCFFVSLAVSDKLTVPNLVFSFKLLLAALRIT